MRYKNNDIPWTAFGWLNPLMWFLMVSCMSAIKHLRATQLSTTPEFKHPDNYNNDLWTSLFINLSRLFGGTGEHLLDLHDVISQKY
jgi:hypothetical protein